MAIAPPTACSRIATTRLTDHTLTLHRWCIFELASFLHFHKNTKKAGGAATEGRIIILPIAIGTFACAMYVTVWLGSISFCVISHYVERLDLLDLTNYWMCLAFYTFLCTPVWWVPKMLFTHYFLLGRRQMERQLAFFKVRSANCQVEADRVHVEATIKEWFGSLHAFEQEVHGDGIANNGLLGVLHRSIGFEHCIDQTAVFFENAACVGAFYDCVALANDPWAVAVGAAFGLSEYFVANPLFIHSLNFCARWLVDVELPTMVKWAIRIVVIPTAFQWFFYLILTFYALPLHWSAAVSAALGVLHYVLRNKGYSQRAHIPFRIASAVTLAFVAFFWPGAWNM